MALKPISRDELSFGRAVLLATDSVGLSAEGAFWLHNNEEDNWDYFLATSLFDRMGPRDVFARLAKALSEKLSESEIEEFSFYVSSPQDALIKKVLSEVQTSPHASAPIEAKITLDGQKVAAHVYRMTGELSKNQARLAQRRFKKLSSELAVA